MTNVIQRFIPSTKFKKQLDRVLFEMDSVCMFIHHIIWLEVLFLWKYSTKFKMEFRVKTLFTKQYRMKIALPSTFIFTFPMKLITCISSENDHTENIVYLSLFFSFCFSRNEKHWFHWPMSLQPIKNSIE